MTSLAERHRPQTFQEVVGQTEAMNRLITVQKVSGLKGQSIMLVGPSGTGKTTIARLIAAKVAGDMTTTEMDAMDVNLDAIRKWEKDCQHTNLFSDGYCFIINEAHNLTSQCVSRLLTLLDDQGVMRNSTWLFTMTCDGKERLFGGKHDASPFVSRSIYLELNMDDDTRYEMAQRVQSIAQKYDIDGRPIGDYVDLINEHNGNMRSAIKFVESGGMIQ